MVPAPLPPVELGDTDLENLRNVIRFLRREYDWILLDLGRGLNRLASALLLEVDDLLLVSTPEVPALHQTARLAEKAQGLGLAKSRTHFIANRLSNSIRQPAGPILQLAERMAGLPVYVAVPNGYIEFCEAYKHGKMLSGAGHLTNAMETIARKLMGDGPEDKPPVSAPFGITHLWGLLART